MNTDDVKYKIEVMQAYAEGKEIQFSMKYDEDWDECSNPIFNWELFNYRVKPKIIEKPSINWDHVSDEFNYLTVDTQGDKTWSYLYKNKPYWDDGWCSMHGGDCETACVFESLNPGNCEPQDSLVCRPGFE